MVATNALQRLRVGWWAGAEPSDPWLPSPAPCCGPNTSPLPGFGSGACLRDAGVMGRAGFTGEAVAVHPGPDWPGARSSPLDILVTSGAPEPGGTKTAQALCESGCVTVAVAPEEAWGCEPHLSVGPPFALPEPALLAGRHLPRSVLEAVSPICGWSRACPGTTSWSRGASLDRPSATMARPGGPRNWPFSACAE